MKILILNSYVRENGGDAAIMSVHVRQLFATYPGAVIKISSLEDPRIRDSYEGAQNIGSIRRYVGQEDVSFLPRLGRKALSLLVALFCFRSTFVSKHFFMNRFVPNEMRTELEALREADLVVPVGGGQLNAVGGLGGDLNVFYLTLPILLAERLGKPLVTGPSSFGPFVGILQKWLVRKALHNATLVMLREEISYDLLVRLGVSPAKLLLTVDAGFAFTATKRLDVRKTYGFKKSSKVVAITMRSWFSGQRRVALERSFASFIDALHNKGYEVLLVPQVTTPYRKDDDRLSEARIASYCQTKMPVLVTNDANADTLKALYDDIDFVVGTRFHSVIFAITSYIPCMAVEYDHKTSGIMQSLDLGEWVINLNDVTSTNLIKMFSALENESHSYVKTLRRKVPQKIKEAASMVATMKKTVERQ